MAGNEFIEIVVDKVDDRKPPSGNFGPSCKIHQGNRYWYFSGDGDALLGHRLKIESVDKGKYKVARLVTDFGVAQGQSSASTGSGTPSKKLTVSEMLNAIQSAHATVVELEPDVIDANNVLGADRSEIRAKILTTLIIALADGRIVPDVVDVDSDPFA